MSLHKKITISCPKCGNSFPATIFDSVNTDFAKDIASQIIDGRLFSAKCPCCDFSSNLEYNMLYHDMEHMAMIWVIHKEAENYLTLLEEARAGNILHYKTTRIVENMNALREKVACLEMSRDDRIIELCKIFATYSLLAKQPSFDFNNAFYTVVNGKELIFLYDKQGNDFSCGLSENVYDYLRDLYFNSAFAGEFDHNYAIVDFAWAEPILDSLLKNESEAIKKNKQSDIEPQNNEVIRIKNRFCRRCGSKLLEESRFCTNCGTKVETEESSSNQPAATVTLQNQPNMAIASGNQNRRASQTQRFDFNKEHEGIFQGSVAAASAARDKKIAKKTLIIFFAAVFLIIGLVVFALSYAKDNELRNFATEEMDDDYSNVYADVTAIIPEYYIYQEYSSQNRYITDIVCRARTVEGKVIWVSIPVSKYPDASRYYESTIEKLYYSSSNPMRLSGSVTTSERILEKLANKIGDVYILDVKKMQR